MKFLRQEEQQKEQQCLPYTGFLEVGLYYVAIVAESLLQAVRGACGVVIRFWHCLFMVEVEEKHYYAGNGECCTPCGMAVAASFCNFICEHDKYSRTEHCGNAVEGVAYAGEE